MTSIPAVDYPVFRISNNTALDSLHKVSGDNIVYQSTADIYDYSKNEIYLFDGVETFNLSNNNVNDGAPDIEGERVVWESWDTQGQDWDIYLYDHVTKTKQMISNNSGTDWAPLVSDDLVVWEGYDGNDWEIFVYDGVSTFNLTNNQTNDKMVEVDGNKVVWVNEGDRGNDEIFLYDGESGVTTRITSNNSLNNDPMIDGDKIVWESYATGNWEIFLYDIVSGVTENISNNPSYPDFNPKISDGNVIWLQKPSEWSLASDLYLYDGESIKLLSGGIFWSVDPQISGENVVWQGYDFAYGEDIFLYDGESTVNLTGNLPRDLADAYPQIDSNHVIWSTYLGLNTEIYSTQIGSSLSEPTDGNDRIVGGIRNNFLSGDKGDDELFGGEGSDTLEGGEGNDLLLGGIGQDHLFGNEGDDVLWGNEHGDHLTGGIGNDQLLGGEGEDSLIGDSGEDVLDGGSQSDRLSGGAGRDVFILKANGGSDIVTDFEQGVDVIGLADGITFDQLEFWGWTVESKSGASLVMTNVFTNSLTAADFITVD